MHSGLKLLLIWILELKMILTWILEGKAWWSRLCTCPHRSGHWRSRRSLWTERKTKTTTLVALKENVRVGQYSNMFITYKRFKGTLFMQEILVMFQRRCLRSKCTHTHKHTHTQTHTHTHTHTHKHTHTNTHTNTHTHKHTHKHTHIHTQTHTHKQTHTHTHTHRPF